MTAVNVHLYDQDGRSDIIRGCRGPDEIAKAKESLERCAEKNNWKKPFVVETKKMI